MADSPNTRIAGAVPVASKIPAEIFESIYAFRMPNDDMEPVFSAGNLLIVNPTRPPESGKNIVLFNKDRSAFVVREFLRADPVQWVVRKYGDEPIEENISREEWPIADFIFEVHYA